MKRFASVMIAGLLLTGCSSVSNSSSPSSPDVTPAGEASSMEKTPSPTPTPSDTPDKSERGNLIKQVGAAAGVTSEPGGGKELLTFVVEDIEVGAKCTAEHSRPSENGRFVVVTLDVTTVGEPAFTENFYGPISFDAQSWKVIGPNGTTLNTVSSGPAYGCLSPEQQLPPSIGAGEKVTGKIVFDLPVKAGTLIYSMPLLGSNVGWEWEFPSEPK